MVVDLASRIRLVSAASLTMYEQPNRRVVSEIAWSVNNTGALRNPIVVDPTRRLLIDGHHRSQALQWLGLTRLPCYTVDYLSTEVEVRDWQWLSDASCSAMRDAFALIRGGGSGRWTVVASDTGDDVIASRCFESPLEAAQYLHRVALAAQVAGAHVRRVHALDAVQGVHARSPWSCRVRMAPVVGKDEVINAAHGGDRFPPQVNRHLVHGRPVGMQIPIEALAGDDAFKTFLSPLWEGAEEFRDGHYDDDRFYEERVIDFSMRD